MFTKQEYSDMNSAMKYVFYVISMIIVFSLAWNFLINTPARVVKNYEWFHQAQRKHLTNVANITTLQSQLDVEKDKDEKYRLRTELNGAKMLCVDLVAQYNARSAQVTTSYTLPPSLPVSIAPADCK